MKKAIHAAPIILSELIIVSVSIGRLVLESATTSPFQKKSTASEAKGPNSA